MTKPKSGKLTTLGNSAETLLSGILVEMKRDIKKADDARKYSLTDQMRVVDRVAKFEAIRAKMADDEGSFFEGQPEPDEPAETDDEGAENDGD